MRVQVKNRSGSLVIVLDPVVLKYHHLKEGDWVDISDIVKVQIMREENSTDEKPRRLFMRSNNANMV